MEASALELRQGTASRRGALSSSFLRLRSDEQLVELFRAGHDEAFRAIHDRYRKRLEAYAAQMLGGCRADAEDALQDVFERAYCGLRAHHRDLALRAWLYRVAHNRCVDQLRRPTLQAAMEPDEAESRDLDPVALTEQREVLNRLVVDIGRLPEQQRSALLLRELSGMSHAELATALGVTVPAVKSLLVRARMGLAAAIEARDTACATVREELVLAHDRGARPNAIARRHLRDCAQCRHFRRSVRGVSRNLAVAMPLIGPLAGLLKLLGGGGGAAGGGLGGSGGGAVASGGGAALTGAGGLVAAGGAASTTTVLTGGLAAGGVGHVAALVTAALATAGGVVATTPPSAPPGVINRAAPVSARAWPAPTTSSEPARGLEATPPSAAAPTAPAVPANAHKAATGPAHSNGILSRKHPAQAVRPSGSTGKRGLGPPVGPATSSNSGTSATAGSDAASGPAGSTSPITSTSTGSVGSTSSSGSSGSATGGSTSTASGSSTGSSSSSTSGGTGSSGSTTGSSSVI